MARRLAPRLAAVLAAGLALTLAPDRAGAELSVSPLRQVITPETASATYDISNPSSRIVDIRVRWIDLAAGPDGYAPAPPDLRARLSAAPFLEVSPARLRLEPGARGRVTVRLRKGKAPPAGERRSHLLFESQAVRTPLRRAGGGLEVDLGISISTPVVLRRGALATAPSIGATRLIRTDDGALAVETHVANTGPASSYGRIEIDLAPVASPGAKPRRAATLSNVAVYPDAGERRLTLPLGADALPESAMTIRYTGEAEYAGRAFAERTFRISAPE